MSEQASVDSTEAKTVVQNTEENTEEIERAVEIKTRDNMGFYFVAAKWVTVQFADGETARISKVCFDRYLNS
mgnify:CR=1 FL=1